jgi:hypothetical protein
MGTGDDETVRVGVAETEREGGKKKTLGQMGLVTSSMNYGYKWKWRR